MASRAISIINNGNILKRYHLALIASFGQLSPQQKHSMHFSLSTTILSFFCIIAWAGQWFTQLRHWIHFFLLILIWVFPIYTIDRLLFNLLWTSWIILGSILEEKDLKEQFGNSYTEYQKKVPMLIPNRIFPISVIKEWFKQILR